MSNQKQLVLCQLLTKKVQRLVKLDKAPTDATLVPNEQDNTLDDLLNNPDFKDIGCPTPLVFSKANYV